MISPNSQHISSAGGIIQLLPFGLMLTNPYGAYTADIGVDFDVLRWDLFLKPNYDHVTDTSNFGGSQYDVADMEATWQAVIKWDANNPPDPQIRLGNQVTVGAALPSSNPATYNINLSSQVSLFLGNGQNYPEIDDVAEYYYIPSNKISVSNPQVNPNDHKMVTIVVSGQSSSPVFHMPYDIPRVDRYAAFLQSLGRTW